MEPAPNLLESAIQVVRHVGDLPRVQELTPEPAPASHWFRQPPSQPGLDQAQPTMSVTLMYHLLAAWRTVALAALLTQAPGATTAQRPASLPGNSRQSVRRGARTAILS